MSAYFILTQTITDPEQYRQAYIPAVLPFLTKYKAEVLVADFEATALQGEPASGVVVIKFPSEKMIQEFVNDPQYKPVKVLRLAITTNANAVMEPAYEAPRG
jgi:uncharacterized protein (DUF1330 family)